MKIALGDIGLEFCKEAAEVSMVWCVACVVHWEVKIVFVFENTVVIIVCVSLEEIFMSNVKGKAV